MRTGGEQPRRAIHFAGRRWWIKWASRPVGPGPNWFDDTADSVHVDRDGALVLRVRRNGGRWVCAEVIGEDITGYGRYEWTIRTDLSNLERHVVLGMFTWSDETDRPPAEIDIEVSAWGGGGGVSGQYVVQPAGPDRLRRFTVPRSASSRCSFLWSPGRVAFATDDGQRWTFDGDGVPAPGWAHPRINLWLHRGAEPDVDTAVAVTLGDFRFTPH